MSLVEAAMRTVAGLLLVRLCGWWAVALAVAPTTVCDVVQAGVGGEAVGARPCSRNARQSRDTIK